MRLPAWLTRRRSNAELDEEIEAHLRMAMEDRVARGESRDAARLAARRELGNEGLLKEVTREMWQRHWFDGLRQDTRYAARMMAKNPGFTAVVVATLALGIGANTAIFSVIRAALSPIAIASPERAVMLWTENAKRDWHQFPTSFPDYLDAKASGVFSSLAAFGETGMNLRLGDRTERVEGLNVTPNFFDVFASWPQLGRVFDARDAVAGQTAVVMLSDELWRSRFAGDPGVAGSSVVLDGAPHTIVGVLPKSFPHMGHVDIYRPLAPPAIPDRGSRSLFVAGRLGPDVTLAGAQQRVTLLGTQLAGQYPVTNVGASFQLQPFEEAFVEDAQTLLLVLFGAVGFVLLIACANIANLLLARGTAREREVTIRAALGASRWRLGRQSLTESVCMSALGGVLAIVPAVWAIHVVASFHPDELPNAEMIGLDWRVLLFNFALSLATGVVCGLAPAWQVRRVDINDALKAAGRSVAGGAHPYLRGLLMTGEMALTVVLLVGAGLLLRSFVQLRTSNPGYDPHRVLTMRIALAERQYGERAAQAAFFEHAIECVRALPGVRGAAGTHELPTSDDIHGSGLHFADRPEPRADEVPVVMVDSITPEYLRVMRIPLARGRHLNEADRAGAPLVAMVDEWTARRYWPNEDALGHRLKLGAKEPAREIVGVVGNVELGVMVTLVKGRLGQVYLPFAQEPKPAMSLVVRTAGEPGQLAGAIREALRELDREQPVFRVATMEAARVAGRSSLRLAMWLVGAFAGVAVALAAIGIYGVMAFHVGRRSREFGIRMSLGAQPRDVWLQAVRQAMILNAAGIALGVGGALLLTRLMESLLYGIRATDPATFAAVTACLAMVSVAAAWIPARRATRVDPVQALREE